MLRSHLIFSKILPLFLLSSVAVLPMAHGEAATKLSLAETCFQSLSTLPGKVNTQKLKKACEKAAQLDGCESEDGAPIFHFDHQGKSSKGKRILAFAMIHGDEAPSGTVARTWMMRLNNIETRSTWRIVPVLNPDGRRLKTRMNAHGVDLNRNFPTKDWETNALSYWHKKMKSDPRRFPGLQAASEKETRCAMKQIAEYKPDFIISIHTPLGVLDFDGPKMPAHPRLAKLPWISLGNYPGSLGRYMWYDRSRPVLTVELNGNQVLERLDTYERLQDILGTVAVRVPALMAKRAL